MYKKQISLIIYVSHLNCNEKTWNFIRTQSWYGQIEIIYTLEKLCERFTQHVSGHAVAVLIIASRQELADITQYAELLYDQKIILVLPDRAQETISMGHSLYPRFISYSDSDLQDVSSVLLKMINADIPQSISIQ